jgi:pyruvate dehydrogenase E1 component
MLVDDWQISTDVFSVTSYSELERDARDIARRNRLNGGYQQSHVEGQLPGNEPVIATSDYVRACPQLISPYVEGRFVALGTDGFGRSDTRVNLRSFFEVDRHHIVIAALDALVRDGLLEQSVATSALLKYRINQKHSAPWME